LNGSVAVSTEPRRYHLAGALHHHQVFYHHQRFRLMATVSARRQALADLARSRGGEGVVGIGLRRLAIAVVILGLVTLALMWLFGFFSTPPEVVAVRALVDEQIVALERVARNELPFGSDGESFGAMFTALREVPEGYRDQARAELGRLFEALIGWVIGLGSLGAWLAHVVTCLSDGSWGYLVAGAVFFPIGIIHGIGIWLGFF
jgi:hypothetical protein